MHSGNHKVQNAYYCFAKVGSYVISNPGYSYCNRFAGVLPVWDALG